MSNTNIIDRITKTIYGRMGLTQRELTTFDDVRQIVLCEALRRARTWDKDRGYSFNTYLWSYVYPTCLKDALVSVNLIKYGRHPKEFKKVSLVNKMTVLDGVVSVTEEMDNKLDVEILLRYLPPRKRKVVEIVALEGQMQIEAAARLGISSSTASLTMNTYVEEIKERRSIVHGQESVC